MAKRMRRPSAEDTSHSQSSDSPSGMTDTEDSPEAMSPYSKTSPPSDNGTPSVDTGGETSNTAGMNGIMPTALERSAIITVYGGQGGNGGEGGTTGGAGGAGQGNQLQFYPAGGNIIINVYYEGDRDLDFVWDMVMCLGWVGFSTLALACLHHIALARCS
ncbi:hypothetical protein C8R44DRAFT_881782 [Mycena epipterygia]|nr:hypothetical protein C8R44DRAFT_881782 [Mycena epipterygia]